MWFSYAHSNESLHDRDNYISEMERRCNDNFEAIRDGRGHEQKDLLQVIHDAETRELQEEEDEEEGDEMMMMDVEEQQEDEDERSDEQVMRRLSTRRQLTFDDLEINQHDFESPRQQHQHHLDTTNDDSVGGGDRLVRRLNFFDEVEQ